MYRCAVIDVEETFGAENTTSDEETMSPAITTSHLHLNLARHLDSEISLLVLGRVLFLFIGFSRCF